MNGGEDVQDVLDLIGEPYVTPAQVAKKLIVTPQTAARIMRKIPGTIEIGSDETRFKRKRKFVRTPKSAFDRYLAQQRTVKA